MHEEKMKCLIVCTASAAAWQTGIFPGVSPYMLRLGNKPYLEFLIDFCAERGIREIRFLFEDASEEAEEYFRDGSFWNLKISYGFLKPGLPIGETVHRNEGFAAGGPLLIFSGMFHPRREGAGKGPIPVPEGNRECLLPDGSGWRISVPGGSEYTAAPGSEIGISPESFSSPEDYFRIGESLLKGESGMWNLPGYGASPDVRIGRNVEMPRLCMVTSPVMIGNSVRLAPGTRIGPNVIIGDNVMIDSETEVRDSVILSNTYVGTGLELREKIVCRSVITDPATGAHVDLKDELLFVPMTRHDSRKVCSFEQQLMALVLFLLMLPPFLAIRPFTGVRSRKTLCLLAGGERKYLKLYGGNIPFRLFPVWFRKFSLDKFHLLVLVMRGTLRLVGNPILEATPENEQALDRFPGYAPGIFSYSELLEHENDPEQRDIDELYYLHHADFRTNLKILMKTLIRNFLKQGMPNQKKKGTEVHVPWAE